MSTTTRLSAPAPSAGLAAALEDLRSSASAPSAEQRRANRWRLLRRHATEVYDELTDHRRRYLRLDELFAAAAGSFPELCPPPDAGDEVDLALFVSAMLAVPAVGEHLIAAMQRPTAAAIERLAEFRAAGSLDLGPVHLRRHGDAAHVTLTNGRHLNAEDDRLVAALETAVDVALLDDRVRVGVLRGGPVSHPKYAGRRVFCAGINLTELYHGRISFVDFLLRRELGPLNKMWRGLFDPAADGMPAPAGKPWVGVVDGFAIGGGMQMLLVTDRVIAAEDAYLSVPAAQEGIVPGVANLRLGRLVGSRRARQMILAGRSVAAGEPDGRDLCDEVVPPERIDAAIDRAVTELSSPAALANRHMLNLTEEPVDAFRRYLADFVVIQARRLRSADLAENLERTWMRRQRRS